jgi:D-alanyl-lipoteichoic acid acyltransferase DltB (MBOAT superfamily)
MLFNSIEFLFFFPIVTLIYYLIPFKFRWLHLFIASCVFYCAFIPIYILILFFTIIIDYIAGILIENAEGKRRKLFLVMSIVANVGVLAIFKYYNFFIDNMNALLYSLNIYTHPIPLLNIILPIGLSFHTFQAMSYTIEVYRGNQHAERHLGIYALYVMFYPQLVAGPIERPQNLLHQFREKHVFDYNRVVSGLRLMAWGFFKKLVIADRLAIFVNGIYADPSQHFGLPIIVAPVFFSIQIYCDFSGYSDIALGAARVMGFKLMKNFDRPFFSKSVTEFWRRWHISLSTWFNDYLFSPIVTAKRDWGKWAVVFGLFFTFFLSGLWHGAGWTFILYGVLHGVALIYEFLTKKKRKRISSKLPSRIADAFSMVAVFSYVTFSWIFFRAKTFSHAILMIRNAFYKSKSFYEDGYHYGLNSVKIFYTRMDWIYIIVALTILLIVERIQKTASPNLILSRQPTVVRWTIYYIFLMMLLFGRQITKTQFIYFQF